MQFLLQLFKSHKHATTGKYHLFSSNHRHRSHSFDKFLAFYFTGHASLSLNSGTQTDVCRRASSVSTFTGLSPEQTRGRFFFQRGATLRSISLSTTAFSQRSSPAAHITVVTAIMTIRIYLSFMAQTAKIPCGLVSQLV